MIRVLPFVLIAALFGFTSSADHPGAASRSDEAKASVSGALVAETQPTKDTKATSVDDEIKALNLKTMNLGSAMKQFQSQKVENKFKDFSGGSPDFADARKVGVQIAAMAKVIDWKKNRKRTKDPEAFDKFASDLEAGGKKIAEAAGKKDAEALKSAVSATSQSCEGCHNKFNGK